MTVNQNKIDEGMQEVHQQIAENNSRIKEILDEADFLDEDGYPTESALEAIEKWHWDDIPGWFKFIENLWMYREWGWKEKIEPHDFQEYKGYEGKMVHRYYISTAGWSGNESVIRAMQNNTMMWQLNWVQSRRGGHYIFELREFNDKLN